MSSHKRTFAVLALVGALALTGCTSEVEQIRQQAEVVKACVDVAGQWYSTPGWGESCHFDTRKASR